jgi:predicted phage tail protein
MLDLRLPIGWFFAIVGVLLLAMGIFSPDMRAALTAVNVNLYCGLAMALFGAFLLLLAARARRRS